MTIFSNIFNNLILDKESFNSIIQHDYQIRLDHMIVQM